MTYAMPLADRKAAADYERERYHRDPAYRLKRINLTRARRGLPPRESLEGLA